jgi:hypothetical protein
MLGLCGRPLALLIFLLWIFTHFPCVSPVYYHPNVMTYQENHLLDWMYQGDITFNGSESVIGDLTFFGQSLYRKHGAFGSGPRFPRGPSISDHNVQTVEESSKLTLREDDPNHVGKGSFRTRNR